MSTDSIEPGTLLVVDDNEMNRDMLTRRLQRCGHTVAVAEDGYKALELIGKETFDVVLLDVAMPGIDGLETLAEIRKTRSHTSLPVIMATAMNESADIVKAMKLGANDYVSKPLDFPVVLARVESQLLLKRTVDRIKKLEKNLEQRNTDLQAANAQIAADNERMKQQKEEVERLLDSAVTQPVARVLRETGSYPPTLDEVCVIATDIVGFSKICQTLPPKMVVEELNRFYKNFDGCCLPWDVQPLRSQGDSRIAIAGLRGVKREAVRIPAIDAVVAMLAFRDTLADPAQPTGVGSGGMLWSARIGIQSGPAMVGVMSGTRLCLDVWGETVNNAARLEQGAKPNQMLVSERVLWATRGLFDHGPIEQMRVKDTLVSGAVLMGLREPFRDELGKPNDAFWKVYRDPDHPIVPPDPAGSEQFQHTSASGPTA